MRIFSIICGILSVASYLFWYDYIYYHYDSEPTQLYSDIANIIIYIVLGVSFFVLGQNEKSRIIRYFIYFAIGEFWIFLVLNMIYCLLHYNSTAYYKTIYAIGMVLALNLLVYFIINVKMLIKWLRLFLLRLSGQ